MEHKDLRVGARVHVEFDGVVGSTGRDGAWVKHLGGNNYIPADCIVAAEPEGWPPQLGDIWEKDGEEYCARELRASPHLHMREIVLCAVLASARNFFLKQEGDLDAFLKGACPVLLRRRASRAESDVAG
jgi:hypothetical protein